MRPYSAGGPEGTPAVEDLADVLEPGTTPGERLVLLLAWLRPDLSRRDLADLSGLSKRTVDYALARRPKEAATLAVDEVLRSDLPLGLRLVVLAKLTHPTASNAELAALLDVADRTIRRGLAEGRRRRLL